MSPDVFERSVKETAREDVEDIEIKLLLEGIYRAYGYDFRDYSMSTIRRRIWHRVRLEGMSSITALLERVLHQPLMMERLFRDFTIHVTEMFRDPSFFLSLRQNVIPWLKTLPFIRIWHAGCSTGEEPFSMAILLHEEGLLDKARIYATDLNDALLKQAMTGTYPLNRMKMYTRNYLHAGGNRPFSEYYAAEDNKARFHSFLSEHIVFAQHNLATDHSFNEFHVIICRNVLIYFNRDLQTRVHKLFYESLGQGGILGLGNRETISFTVCESSYSGMDAAERLYRKVK
ncbi:CheR family methyltransferase [Paenibacillus thalictri]|uniref:Protein-glutamate O-methyltransferase CheR n=1 Tax=Paenibacillus thalictri TaxID=2527873 RepID=A0A4Q9DSR3_9BACL|nr:protein-glutamate O-methyltransferase CheR [Paenibacillus thalictri]TBL79934.1 protein-glutamate O-methyltransferase CheR [Paenibacillus thalictri]